MLCVWCTVARTFFRADWHAFIASARNSPVCALVHTYMECDRLGMYLYSGSHWDKLPPVAYIVIYMYHQYVRRCRVIVGQAQQSAT